MLPHDRAAEQAVIGSALMDHDICRDLLETLQAADFFDGRHGLIWQALAECYRQGHGIDVTGIRSQLGHNLQGAGGDAYLLELTDTIPVMAQAEKHAKRIMQLAHVRHIAKSAGEVYQSAFEQIEDLDGWIDNAENVLNSAPERPGAVHAVPFRNVIDATFAAITKQADSGSKMIGPAIGLTEVDDHLRGLAPGWLVVIGARPGMGKTAIGENAIRHAGGGLVFSLEMTEEQWGRRSLSSDTGIDGHKIRGATGLSREDWMKLTQSAGKLSELPIRFWDKSGTKLQDIVREARRVQREMKGELKLILIDYLQLVVVGGNRHPNRESEVGEISRTLKGLAKELKLCVIALAQLNRGVEGRPNKRPLPSDLRESGAVEQDADVIMFVYRDEVYNPYETAKPGPDGKVKDNRGIAEIIIAKNREGGTGTSVVRWVKETTTFHDLHHGPGSYPEDSGHWNS